MFKFRKKCSLLCIVLCVFAVCLTGCSLIPTLNLTEEESHIIAEYSAGLLLKYDRNYIGNLEDLKEEEPPDTDILNEYTPPEPEAIEQPDTDSEDYMFDEDGSDNSELLKSLQNVEYTESPIAEALGLEGFEVSYSGYEILDTYPDPSETNDLIFSMEARPGKQLLVLHFNVTNTTEYEKTCDILDKDTKFRVLINGLGRVPNQFTILMDDFSQYHKDIAAYGTEDAVLIFETDMLGELSSLDFVLNCDNKNFTYKII